MNGHLFGHTYIVGSIALAVAGMSGCGGSYDATLSGEVTLDGEALPPGIVGTIAFHPVAGGPAAYARINDDSTYAVRTGREPGLPSGEYRISVRANEPPEMPRTESGGPPPPGKLITPQWYRSMETSGLRYTVERGRNRFDLQLTSQPPPDWSPRGRR